jgi:hypothetical protein
MAIKMEKDDLTGVVKIRTERFRMCKSWEIDIQYDFNSDPWTCRVLKDQTVGEAHKEKVADEIETVKAALASYHEDNSGEGVSRIQIVSLLKTVGIGRVKAEKTLEMGAKSGKWKVASVNLIWPLSIV